MNAPLNRIGKRGRKRASNVAVPSALLVQCDVHDEPLSNIYNAMLALRTMEEVSGAFAYNEMMRTIFVRKTLPVRQGGVAIPVEAPRPVTDNDVSQLQEFIQQKMVPRLSKTVLHQAIDLVAQQARYHPVRDYLEKIQWDGVPRVGTWLSLYMNAENKPYTAAVGQWFLLAAVARVFQPGCKFDYMLVLQGPQGVRKSTACSILGGEWYSDNLPDIASGGKDLSIHLDGKWIIEIAEMSSMSRSESDQLKMFFSRREEKFRPPYGRQEVMRPRQCGFIGTTNKSAYLRDETGARRYWPVNVGQADTDALARDRDQLFAEAVQLYRAGNQWWPSEFFEKTYMVPEQDDRYDADVWEGPIEEFLSQPNMMTVIVGDIARKVLQIETGRIGRAEQNRITAILCRLGWTRGRKNGQGNIPWEHP